MGNVAHKQVNFRDFFSLEIYTDSLTISNNLHGITLLLHVIKSNNFVMKSYPFT